MSKYIVISTYNEAGFPIDHSYEIFNTKEEAKKYIREDKMNDFNSRNPEFLDKYNQIKYVNKHAKEEWQYYSIKKMKESHER